MGAFRCVFTISATNISLNGLPDVLLRRCTHVVEDDAIVLLATEHSHQIRKLLQVAGEQAKGLLKREGTHSVLPMQEGPKTIRTG